LSRRTPTRQPSRGRERPLREDLITQTCLEAYGAIRHEGRLADRALERTLRTKRHLHSSERRAVAERVYSLLRSQITVDRLLAVARPGLEELPTSRQDALRLGASRILQGDEAAPVVEALGLSDEDAAALARLPGAAEVLDRLPEAERFAVSASLPPFLAERIRVELGPEADAFAAAINERAPLVARVNLLKTDREELLERLRKEGLDCSPTELSALGIRLDTRVNAFSLPPFREGWFEIQDEGSQLLGMLVDAPPTRVVDACAGAGGKTLQLAAQMHNRGELFALDVDEGRLDELRQRARRAGVHNVRARKIPSDDSALEELSGLRDRADRVLIDAPCTGSGTFRRKPDARYRLRPEDIPAFAAKQSALLLRFASLVKPGGRLIYGTCSVFTEENEAVVEDFLKSRPDFSVRPASDLLGAEVGPKTTRGGFLRVAPHPHGTDGFFGAVLVRGSPGKTR
jgi:16S rRNA (cytosine967-C5)-methyltransferase